MKKPDRRVYQRQRLASHAARKAAGRAKAIAEANKLFEGGQWPDLPITRSTGVLDGAAGRLARGEAEFFIRVLESA